MGNADADEGEMTERVEPIICAYCLAGLHADCAGPEEYECAKRDTATARLGALMANRRKMCYKVVMQQENYQCPSCGLKFLYEGDVSGHFSYLCLSIHPSCGVNMGWHENGGKLGECPRTCQYWKSDFVLPVRVQ